MIRIHLTSRNGIYQVVSHSLTEMVLTTNSGPRFKRPFTDFDRLAGGTWNVRVPQYQMLFFIQFLRIMFESRPLLVSSTIAEYEQWFNSHSYRTNHTTTQEENEMEYKRWCNQVDEDHFQQLAREAEEEVQEPNWEDYPDVSDRVGYMPFSKVGERGDFMEFDSDDIVEYCPCCGRPL